MKIATGGTPIFVSARRYDGGAVVLQGTSRIGLRPEDAEALVRALQKVIMPPGQRVNHGEQRTG